MLRYSVANGALYVSDPVAGYLAVAEATACTGCYDACAKKQSSETDHDGGLNTGLSEVARLFGGSCVFGCFLSGSFLGGSVATNAHKNGSGVNATGVTTGDGKALFRNVVGDFDREGAIVADDHGKQVADVAEGVCIAFGENVKVAAGAFARQNEDRVARSERFTGEGDGGLACGSTDEGSAVMIGPS